VPCVTFLALPRRQPLSLSYFLPLGLLSLCVCVCAQCSVRFMHALGWLPLDYKIRPRQKPLRKFRQQVVPQLCVVEPLRLVCHDAAAFLIAVAAHGVDTRSALLPSLKARARHTNKEPHLQPPGMRSLIGSTFTDLLHTS
jgi:hypothetical protein